MLYNKNRRQWLNINDNHYTTTIFHKPALQYGPMKAFTFCWWYMSAPTATPSKDSPQPFCERILELDNEIDYGVLNLLNVEIICQNSFFPKLCSANLQNGFGLWHGVDSTDVPDPDPHPFNSGFICSGSWPQEAKNKHNRFPHVGKTNLMLICWLKKKYKNPPRCLIRLGI